MKLLGWMVRKSKQKSNEPVKHMTTVGSISGNNGTCISAHHASQQQCAEYSFALSGKPKEELFHGFLAIGTLGTEAVLKTEPSTPMHFEHVTHEQTNITHQHLKHITRELEKFLETTEIVQESPNRSIHGKVIDEGKKEDCGNNILDCPLQKYLFGTCSTDLPEEEMEVKKHKEPFMTGKCESQEKQGKGEYTKNFIKKMLIKNHSKSRSHSIGGATESVSIKKKLPNVLKMFKKKVYPEGQGFIAEDENRESRSSIGRPHSGADMGNKKSHPIPILEKEFRTTYDDAFKVKNEHWIKTDEDYLVLEL